MLRPDGPSALLVDIQTDKGNTEPAIQCIYITLSNRGTESLPIRPGAPIELNARVDFLASGGNGAVELDIPTTSTWGISSVGAPRNVPSAVSGQQGLIVVDEQ